MKRTKLLTVVLVVLLAALMVAPSFAALVAPTTTVPGTIAGTQTGETYFDPTTAVVTQTPTKLESGVADAQVPGVWEFLYPVVLTNLSCTVANATDAQANAFEGYIGNGRWVEIGKVSSAGTLATTSTYSYTKIRYTGDPTAVTNVTFTGQYLRVVTGDIVKYVDGSAVAQSGRTFASGAPMENAFDYNRATHMQMEKDGTKTNNVANFTDSWVYVELEKPTLVTDVAFYHCLDYTTTSSPNEKVQMYKLILEFSMDGTTWYTPQDAFKETANLTGHQHKVTYTAAEWTENQTAIKASPYYYNNNYNSSTPDADVTVTYVDIWDADYTGQILSAASETVVCKFIRARVQEDRRFAMADMVVYGVDPDAGKPTKVEWSYARNMPLPVQTLTPIESSALTWKFNAPTQLTNISFTYASALKDGMWYGATDGRVWYPLATVGTTGSVTVKNSIGFTYLKFVGDTASLATDSVVVTGRALDVRGPFVDYKKGTDGKPATFSTNMPTSVTTLDRSFDHDTGTAGPAFTGVTAEADGTAIITVGAELETQACITEVVIYVTQSSPTRLNGAKLQASLDGVMWDDLGSAPGDKVTVTNPANSAESMDTYAFTVRVDTNASTNKRAYRYIRLIRTRTQSHNFSVEGIDVYGFPYGNGAYASYTAPSPANVELNPYYTTQTATLLESASVTATFANLTIFSATAVKAGPDVKVEGSPDGVNWFNMDSTYRTNADAISIYNTRAVRYLRYSSAFGVNKNSITATGYNPGLTGEMVFFDTDSIYHTASYDNTSTAVGVDHCVAKTWLHNYTSWAVASSGKGTDAYTEVMFKSPAKITEIMLYPRDDGTNYDRMNGVQLQAATALAPNTWVTLVTITADATLYAPSKAASGVTGIKYTLNDNTVYNYFRIVGGSGVALTVAAVEVYGTSVTGNPANGDATNPIWFVIAPISIVAGGTVGLFLYKKKKANKDA